MILRVFDNVSDGCPVFRFEKCEFFASRNVDWTDIARGGLIELLDASADCMVKSQ